MRLIRESDGLIFDVDVAQAIAYDDMGRRIDLDFKSRRALLPGEPWCSFLVLEEPQLPL